MAGIQVHTSSPINTNAPKSQEATAESVTTQEIPAQVPASTTAYSVNSAQTAQPGAPAMPSPSTTASKYAPSSPTKTTPMPVTSNPPPPQPGQVPRPFSDEGENAAPAAPPPLSSQTPEGIASHTQTQPNYPLPLYTPPKLVTSTYAYAHPPAGQTATHDLSHPPGYVQNSHASFDDRYIEPENTSHTPSPTKLGRGLLDGEPALRNADEQPSPIWNAAVSWAKEAGKKLSEVEDEVWRKINGDR